MFKSLNLMSAIKIEFIVIKIFDKSYKHNWTREIFIISNFNQTSSITYKLKDLNNEDIIGSFYSQELQLSKF